MYVCLCCCVESHCHSRFLQNCFSFTKTTQNYPLYGPSLRNHEIFSDICLLQNMASNVCPLCNERVLSHSVLLTCSVCSCQMHIHCLSDVNHTDWVYTERNENCWISKVCVQDIFPFNCIDDNDLYLSVVPLCSNHVNDFNLNLSDCRIFETFEGNPDIVQHDFKPSQINFN